MSRAPGDDKLIVDMKALPEDIKKQLFSLFATSNPATVSNKEPTTDEEWKKGTPLIQPNFQVQQGAQGANRDAAAPQGVSTDVSTQKVRGIQDISATSPSAGSFRAQGANRDAAAPQGVSTGVSTQEVRGSETSSNTCLSTGLANQATNNCWTRNTQCSWKNRLFITIRDSWSYRRSIRSWWSSGPCSCLSLDSRGWVLAACATDSVELAAKALQPQSLLGEFLLIQCAGDKEKDFYALAGDQLSSWFCSKKRIAPLHETEISSLKNESEHPFLIQTNKAQEQEPNKDEVVKPLQLEFSPLCAALAYGMCFCGHVPMHMYVISIMIIFSRK